MTLAGEDVASLPEAVLRIDARLEAVQRMLAVAVDTGSTAIERSLRRRIDTLLENRWNETHGHAA